MALRWVKIPRKVDIGLKMNSSFLFLFLCEENFLAESISFEKLAKYLMGLFFHLKEGLFVLVRYRTVTPSTIALWENWDFKTFIICPHIFEGGVRRMLPKEILSLLCLGTAAGSRPSDRVYLRDTFAGTDDIL